jgi:hypothetical protein
VDVCTIIAKNYVAQARVLARSFAEHHPDGRFWTLIIDDFEGFIDPEQEPFSVLTPADIGCDEFPEMAGRYTVLELSTAVKPWLLRHLMDQSGSPVTYLDPDIKVYGSLERLEQLAADHGVVLIPHNTEPLPHDGHRPRQVDVMIAGIYNLGHLSVAPGPEVDALIEWWADRLRRDCRVDPIWGYFVDQRWFDLVPGFLADFAILRDPEFNVAYWNLHSRTFEYRDDRYLVDGRPLAFFHFSGFNPEKPEDLSLHQDRIEIADVPALARICEEYAEDTMREGFAVASKWPYTYSTLDGGLRFDDTLRKLFWIGEDHGELDASPFTRDGSRAFLAWLGNQEPTAAPGVNRLLAHVYGSRRDLQEQFPDLTGPDLGKLLVWSQGQGSNEVPALALLPLPEGAAHAIAWSQSPRRRTTFRVRRGVRRALRPGRTT